MRDAYADIRAAGGELVAIGNGKPEHARDFREEQQIEFPLVVDPELTAYAAAGLRRGVLDALGPRTLGNAWRALRSGARQGSVLGDPWQLGGTFVLERGGDVVWKHIARDPGDHPDPSKVLRALQRAAKKV